MVVLRIMVVAHFQVRMQPRLTVQLPILHDMWQKNLVAAGVADKLELQVAYAIGVAQPVSLNIDTFGTAKIAESKIRDMTSQLFDFRPLAIINHLNLRRPIYKQTAAFGHFGRTDIDLPWEALDKIDEIKALL